MSIFEIFITIITGFIIINSIVLKSYLYLFNNKKVKKRRFFLRRDKHKEFLFPAFIWLILFILKYFNSKGLI